MILVEMILSLFDVIKYPVYLDSKNTVHHPDVPNHFIDKWKSRADSLGIKFICNPTGVRLLRQVIEEYEETDNEPI